MILITTTLFPLDWKENEDVYHYTPADHDAVIAALQTLDLAEAENMDLREVLTHREVEISDLRDSNSKKDRKIDEQRLTIQILIGTTIALITGVVLMLATGA